MKEIIIGKNDAGQRLDRFLVKAFAKFSQGMIRKEIRKGNIKVDKKKQPADYRLVQGEVLRLYLPDELFAANSSPKPDFQASTDIDVIYEDENIMLVNKPSGLVVHADDTDTQDTLIARIIAYLIKSGEYSPEDELSFCPALCNRIDRNTSGIVIAAKNAESLRIMSEKIKHREIKKTYLAVVTGQLQKKPGVLTAYLEKKESENRVVVSDRKTPTNKTIKTGYKVLSSTEKLSLVEVDLLTGRTHQIRAHFAYIGHPLLGDGKYGKNSLNKEYGAKSQALCSYKLKFCFQSDAGILEYLNGREFSCPRPPFVEKYCFKFVEKG